MTRWTGQRLISLAFVQRSEMNMPSSLSMTSSAGHWRRKNTCGIRQFALMATVVPEDFRDTLRSAMRSPAGGQVVFGSVVGFATGYSIKKIGQLLLVLIGLEVAALQWMSSRGWVDVKWKTISKELSPHVEKDAMNRVVEAVKLRMPFAGSFSAGCYAGLAWK